MVGGVLIRRIGFMSAMSFVLNAVYLSGCLQPPMRPLALYKVEVKTLARGLESRSGIEPLVVDELPIAWHFGISGVCDEFPKGTYCHPGFPGTHNTLERIEKSLRESYAREDDKQSTKSSKTKGNSKSEANKEITKVLGTWTEAYKALAKKTGSDVDLDLPTTLVRAGGGFVLIAALMQIGCFFLCIYLWFKHRAQRKRRQQWGDPSAPETLDTGYKGQHEDNRVQRFRQERPGWACLLFMVSAFFALFGTGCAAGAHKLGGHSVVGSSVSTGPALIFGLILAGVDVLYCLCFWSWVHKHLDWIFQIRGWITA